MPIIKWSNDFSVGNERIDAQHKKWIAIYNTAHGRMRNASLNDLLTIGSDALSEMIAYTKYHFSFEEQFMETIRYSGIETHTLMHKNFIKKLDQLVLQIHQGTIVLNSEIIKLIENWFVDHILKEDQKFNRYSR